LTEFDAAIFSGMRKFNAAIQFDGKWFVARCLDLPVTSQGETVEIAKANLKEAIELYIESWGIDEVEDTVGEPELAKLEVAV
jgi:predicted RNase H-like HicB family nuclease